MFLMHLDKDKKLLYIFYDVEMNHFGRIKHLAIWTFPWRKTPAIEETYTKKFVIYLPPPSGMTTAVIDVSLYDIDVLELRIKESGQKLLPSLKRIKMK